VKQASQAEAALSNNIGNNEDGRLSSRSILRETEQHLDEDTTTPLAILRKNTQ